MPRVTPSIAKNHIGRALHTVYDPWTSNEQINLLWAYFDNQCAYCGVNLDKKNREGSIDHILSQAQGGTNAIHNLVLACLHCNGDLKRDMEWELYLSDKAFGEIHVARKAKIEDWMSMSKGDEQIDSESLASLDSIINDAKAAFDLCVERVRELKKMNGGK